MSVRHAWILLYCALVFAIGQFHRAAGGILSPTLSIEFNLSASALGSVIGVMFITSMVMQLPTGMLLDRFGARRILPIMLTTVGVGSVVYANASTLEMVYVGRILLGLGFAASGAASHLLFSRWFPKSRMAQVSGLMVAIGGVGGLSGTYPLAAAIEVFGWREIIQTAGFFVLLVAALGAITIRAAPPGAPPRPVPTGIKEMLLGFREILRNRDLPKILTLSFVAFAPITTIAGLWGGPYFRQVHGFDPEETGAVLFALFLTAMVSGLIVGPLDRILGTRKFVILAGAFISASSFGLLAILERPPAHLAIFLLVLMTFSQGFYLTLSAHNRALVADHLVARASTLMSLCAVAGIPLMQSSVGVVLDWGHANGMAQEDAFRLAFGLIAVVIGLLAAIYATAKDAKP